MNLSFSSWIKKMKPFWLACGLFGLLFVGLLSVRLGVFKTFYSAPKDKPFSIKNPLFESDSWMNIFQNGRKIGYSHTTLSKREKGYIIKETLYIRINTMGMIQDINMNTGGRLNLDYSLSSFDFEIRSGRFRFTVNGTVKDDMLSVNTQSTDSSHHIDIRIKDKIYVTSGIVHAIRYDELEPGESFAFQIFDPLSMGQESIDVKVIGKEEILNMGTLKKAKKLAIAFKGTTQQVWIGEGNEILKEKGMLGISFERATREDVLFGSSIESSQDLTKVASIPSHVEIKDVRKLKRLELEINGIHQKGIHLNGGRQIFKDNILVINKETLTDLISSMDIESLNHSEKKFLMPSLFVQSDHPKIINLVNKIIAYDDNPLERANKIVDWIHKNIEKRPVLSLPDAVSTLTHRVGDCNEHAVLLAALARAAGIPTKVEAGLVYLNGRFYYHAWNLLYLGKWITVDSLFNQIPADVTHIRLISGASSQQADLINIIGKIKLRINKVE